MIKYSIERNISYQEFKEVLIKSSLGERRPVDDDKRLKSMVDNANLIVTARDGAKLIGIARCLTDYSYCTYLSDLAVDLKYQHQGVGRELIKQAKLAAPDAKLILLSAPKAVNYYPKIGFSAHTACYYLNRIEELK